MKNIHLDTARGAFDCCKYCVDRKTGCHGTCKEYIEAKIKHNKEKGVREKQNKIPTNQLKRNSRFSDF